ncbi:GNAT family N-acetyltransferase [Paenibacillus sp. FSL L8-0494]|uniref:GNAT family N-acetyltransferase n=1 Tax=Paenibacillus sp. FSL L8-0494 TaxID=2975352 RepID=UPI0030FB9EF2
MFKNSFLKAKAYKYSSLQYLDVEELELQAPEDILIDEPGVFILCKSVDEGHNIHWAAESTELFRTALIDLTSKFIQLPVGGTHRMYIEFIHPDLMPVMESLGFKVVSQFIDFWNEDISKKITDQAESPFIRNIEHKDYLQVSMITKACINLSRGFYGEELDFIQTWNESDHSCILVAELNKSIVGVCLLNIYGFENEKGPVLWLRELAVDPKYHNQGIGHKLAVEGIRWGNNNGAKRSFLAADKENRNAIRIYNELGYNHKDEVGQINMALVLGIEEPI